MGGEVALKSGLENFGSQVIFVTCVELKLRGLHYKMNAHDSVHVPTIVAIHAQDRHEAKNFLGHRNYIQLSEFCDAFPHVAA